jgi:hypothetical protein
VGDSVCKDESPTVPLPLEVKRKRRFRGEAGGLGKMAGNRYLSMKQQTQTVRRIVNLAPERPPKSVAVCYSLKSFPEPAMHSS